MANSALIQVRIDEDIKRKADALFADLGLDTTTAIRIFLNQSIRREGIPFEVARPQPNKETLEAIDEVRRMKKDPTLGKAYTDIDQMMKELLA